MPAVTHKTVIIVAGPTAVGKTALTIKLARHFHTEIISADSRQCFKELNVGVARPSPEELAAVRHHFIASHSIEEEVNASVFERFALHQAEKIFLKHDILLITGGTGLYIKAFCEGLDEIPAADLTTRKKIIKHYEKNGIKWLQGELKKKDEFFFSKGEMKNPQRMMRALEVMETTGKSILSFHHHRRSKRGFGVIKIGLKLPKEQLDHQIGIRTDNMINQGLLEEVKSLSAKKHLNALQTVGYSEIFDHLDGKISLDKAVESIKTHTRQYAKRQMTWLKKDESYLWFQPGNEKEILDCIEKKSSVKNHFI